MAKKKRAVVVGAACLAMSLVVLSFTGMMPQGGMPADQMENTQQKTVVETMRPTRGNIVVSGSYVGTVEPGQQVVVYPKASGEVTSANYNVGDQVEAGAVLFQLDSSNLQLNIAQTQASLASQEARAQLSLEIAQQDLETYNSNIDDGYNSNLLKAESDVTAAENALLLANNNYRLARQEYNDYINGNSDDDYSDSRKESLRNARVQAELQVENAQNTLENAKASLEATKKQLQDQSVTTENSVKSAELSTDFTADYIGLQQLQKNLRDYTATSPISGVVEQRNIDPYDMVSTGTVAYIISNKEVLSVTFDVTESALSSMRVGDQLTLEKDGQTCIGAVSEIATMANEQNGLYTIKAAVESAPFEMRSGSTVKLYVDTQKAENEMLLPIDAVYYDNGTPYIYVFENNAARRMDVETGISDDTHIQIKSGLSLNDEVIVTWSASLYDGAEVYLPGTVPTGAEDAEDPAEQEGNADEGELPEDETTGSSEGTKEGGLESEHALESGAKAQESGDDDSQNGAKGEAE